MYLVKCDACGKVQEAPVNVAGEPVNPVNPETGEKWWSRVKDNKGEHACSRECRRALGGAPLPW